MFWTGHKNLENAGGSCGNKGSVSAESKCERENIRDDGRTESRSSGLFCARDGVNLIPEKLDHLRR